MDDYRALLLKRAKPPRQASTNTRKDDRRARAQARAAAA
jgi:hypothetical protein